MALPANWNDFSNMDAERWIATANRYLPGIVALILVVMLGWQLAGLAWSLVPGSAQGDPVMAAPPSTSIAATGSQSCAPIKKSARRR